MNAQNRWLFPPLRAVPCSYRCRHCDFAPAGSFEPVPMARLLEFVQPLVEARDSATAIEGLRLDAADLEQLDASVRVDLADLKPETEWAEELSTRDDVPFTASPRIVHVAVEPSVAGFLDAWNREYEAWRTRYPSIAELARTYGDPTNTCLHDSRIIIRKWCAAYEGTHLRA
ncbi:MAG: hypothetical protein JW889_09805 [Verrucomicrobia bacterium]|nr:hypothetical protein [Verrucomicrobiota bacterium]